ncbi:MAG: signal peptidase I [Sideroxydans sp.]|nr:signal peptidase I [Sideroxydans sp.]MDD5056620.1 signal peptidase I [Sideroxydans sp.]
MSGVYAPGAPAPTPWCGRRLLKTMGKGIVFFSFVLLITASVLNMRLLYDEQNASCLPYTLYLVRYHHVSEFKRGDIIAFTPGTRMGYLFDGKVIVKMVGAVAGDVISVKSGEFSINNKVIGPLDIEKSASSYMKRDVASFERTETVPPGNVLMIGTVPHSFDGRYWGFLPQEAVIGSVYPIF